MMNEACINTEVCHFSVFLLNHFDLFQEAQLCFPHRYLAMLGPCPNEPRPLRAPVTSKKKSYLEVAKILLRKHPCQSTARACKLILRICRNEDPQAVPHLDWFERPPEDDVRVDLTAPSALGRLAPVMRFNAVLNR